MPTLPIDKYRLDQFGQRMFEGSFSQYKRDRSPLEQQWLQNLRQANGIHDPEVVSKLRKTGSRAYPRMTRGHCIDTLSNMMELLFPNTEKNWDMKPTPIPELSRSDTQMLLNDLQALELQSQELVTDEDIERAIKQLAEAKCDRMRRRIADQLEEMEYPVLARAALKSGITYGIGLLSGPMVESATRVSWRRGPDGNYVATENSVLKPVYFVEAVWDWYPDLSYKSLDQQDGYFFRRVFSRQNLRKLAERPDFMGERIIDWLEKHENGNYTEEPWEQDIRAAGERTKSTSFSGRKYQALERWGAVSGHELRAAGVDISESDLGEEFEACVWMIDATVIKAIVNPMQRKRRPLHTFIFEDSDLTSCGIGIPQIDRDSQLAVCEAARMTLDNCSAVCGPNVVVDPSQVLGNDMDVYAFKSWVLDPDRDRNLSDPVRELKFDSHINELLSVIELFKRLGDEETNASPLSRIQSGGSEALRTEGNMSMVMGKGSLPIKDTVRNFDKFTTSVIGSLYDWNMEFGTDNREKGDYQVVPKASASLMAKEVRARAMDYLIATIRPEEVKHVKWREMLIERMKVRDLPVEDLLEDIKVVEAREKEASEQQQALMDQQRELLAAQIRLEIANAMKSMALAKKADTSADVNLYQAMLDGILKGESVDELEAKVETMRARAEETRARARALASQINPQPALPNNVNEQVAA